MQSDVIEDVHHSVSVDSSLHLDSQLHVVLSFGQT